MVPRSRSWFCPCGCEIGGSSGQNNTSQTNETSARATGPTFMNGVYFPSWMVYKNKTPATLDVANITHVFYAFVGVNEDGSLRSFDEHADMIKQVDGEKGALAALAKLKRNNPTLKTIVSIGGGTGSKEFPALASSHDARVTFARQAREFCDRHEIDGVDIDWEHPKNEEQGRNYVNLLRECRNALPKEDYFLTTALPVGKYILKHIDLGLVARLVNYVNLMAYDFTGSWTNVCGNHAQLHLPRGGECSHPELNVCATDGVEYVLSKDFPSEKLVLGIPVYARYFPRANRAGCSTENAGEMDYCEIPDQWVRDAVIDDIAVAARYVDRDGDKGYLTFDVPTTAYDKGRYVARRGLGGLFYWTGTGDKAERLSLVAAGKKGLDSPPPRNNDEALLEAARAPVEEEL
ncbi:glycoside hydrolase family 18 protein [Trichoderma barbatum]